MKIRQIFIHKGDCPSSLQRQLPLASFALHSLQQTRTTKTEGEGGEYRVRQYANIAISNFMPISPLAHYTNHNAIHAWLSKHAIYNEYTILK